ncbi:MAG: hypothetical protein AB7V44_19710, partial [Pseudonocardia sp.]
DRTVEIPVAAEFRSVLGRPEEAYERIFADALAGDPTHFARMDTIVEAWRIVAPILDDRSAPAPYRRGTWGPAAAEHLPGAAGWVPLPPPA